MCGMCIVLRLRLRLRACRPERGVAVAQALRAVDELRASVEAGPAVEKPAPPPSPPRSLLEDIAVPECEHLERLLLKSRGRAVVLIVNREREREREHEELPKPFEIDRVDTMARRICCI